MESLPQSEARPPATAAETPTGSVDDAPHLADPRALQILSTEHWSLLTARSLVYNETFSRGSMFLTFLSASLVALGFVYQAHSTDFVLVVIAILSLDLFVGVATLGRLASASMEEIKAVQAMNRIRHAYLEMVPTLEPYFSTSRYDDARSVLAVYGPTAANPSVLVSVLHGLTTMPGMIEVLDAALAGAIAAAITTAAGSDMRTAMIVGLVVGIVAALAFVGYAIRIFGGFSRTLVPRFPAPDAAALQPPGRRNT